MKVTNTRLIHALISFLMITFFSNPLFAHFGSKGPFGGSVNVAITFDSTVYLGTFDGGVYRSSNSALAAWTAMPVGLKSGNITALAHSGSYLFAGTFDAGVYIFNGYVGTDRHWVQVNTGLSNLKIKSLLALDSITLLVGTDGGGLFKTTNKGGTWSAVSSAALDGQSITALVKVGGKIMASTLDGGVFVSGNAGASWMGFNDVNTLNIGGTIGLSYNASTDELAVINQNGLFVLASASNAITPVFNLLQLGLGAGVQLRMVSNNSTNWFLATDQGVYVSSGLGWIQSNTGLATMDVRVVVPFKTDLVAGTWKEGIFKSPAANISWIRRVTNFNNLETYAMETSGEKVVVVATEKGVFVSRDLASTYIRANVGLTDSLHVTSLEFSGAQLFASTRFGGVFVSQDTGRTWTILNNGLSNLNVRKIFASDFGVYLADDGNKLFHLENQNWVIIQAGLPDAAIPSSMTFYAGKILLGTMGHGVFVKESGNGSWTAANTGLSHLMVTSVVASGSKLFAGTDGAGVFVSDQNTIQWSATAPVSIAHTVKMGLDGTKIQDMAYYDGYVFASYKGGLLTTSDHGASWIAGGNQFNLPSYTDVRKISFVTTRVFVTTEHNSVYSNALSELPVITSSQDLNSALNVMVVLSPNPASGSFEVRLEDPEVVLESVSLFDSGGRQVYHTNTDRLQNLRVNGNFAAGVYAVRLVTNKGIAVKKIILE